MASIDAILNVVVAGSAKIDQIINKVNQLGGVIDAINKSPIDLSVSAAEAEIKKFNNAVLAIGRNLKTAEKSVDAATAKIERYQKAQEAAEKAISAANPNTKKYEQAIERRRKANEGLIASLAELKQAEELIDKIDSSGALENAENRKKEAQEAARLTKQINALSEQYLKYGEAQKRASGGQFAGPAPKTISQLNAQAQALALIASNSEVATAAFNRFTLAAELAGQATYYAQQEQLKALSSGLSAEAPGVGFGKGSIAAARSQVQEFVNSYAALTKSEAAMSAFVTQAQRLKSLLPDTVKEFTMLEEVISKASEDLKSIGSIGKIKVQFDIDEERLNRLSQLARRRGAPEAYSIQAGPLPEGERGGARYFAERVEIAEELLKIEKEIIAVQKEFADTRSAEDKKAEESAKRRLEIYKNIKKTASNVGDVLFDATTFGKSSEIKKTIGEITKGARNALVRGGLGLGALGLGGLYEGIGNLKNVDLGGISWGKLNIDYNAIKGPIGAAAKAIGEPINNALQGIPEIIGNFLSALGDIPGALGLAAVAAYAFAPAMKTAADAVFLAGQKFGESDFGQNIKLTLDRQTNLFEEVINAASEMNMALDASKSGLDAVGQAVRSLPALPAAGQTSFKGEVRRGRSGGFIGGGARELLNAEYLSTFKEGDYLPNLKEISQQTKTLASRSDEAAQATLMFAEKLSDAANDLDITREAAFRLSQELADAKTAFEAFKLASFAESANAYSKAVLSINQAFRDYVTAGGKGLDIITQQSQAYVDAAQSAKEYAKSVNAAANLGYEGIDAPAERLRKIQQAQESMGLQPVQAPSLALRPAGFTNQDVRIKNLLDDVAQYEQNLDKIVSDGQLELLQIELSAELDNIETITAAQKAADDARWARETKRLEALPDIADVRRRPISFMTPQERMSGGILDPTSLRADRLRRIEILKQRRDARGRALSEGLIGGAFPLLFGQGAGASLGGLAGGISGGLAGGGLGFGLSLIGTALGTALDQLGAKAVETGKALRDPIAGFEKLKEANLLASKAQEYYIQKLIESGRATEAAAVIQAQIIRKVGAIGVSDLNRLAKSSSDLSKAWAEFNLQLQAAVAGPLAKLLDWITAVLAVGNTQRSAEAGARDLIPTDKKLRAEFDKELAGIFNKVYGTRFTGTGRNVPRGGTEDAIKYLSQDQRGREALAGLGAKFSPRGVTGQVLSPETLDQLRKAAQQAADEIKQAYRDGFKLQQQAIDLERQSINLRRQISDEIFAKQQEVQRAQVEADRLSADTKIKAVDLEYQKRISQEEGRVADLLSAEAELMRVRASGQADIDSERKLLELDINKQERETQNYIKNISSQVDNMRRQTLQYEMDVADYREQVERRISEQRRIDQAGAAANPMRMAPNGRQYYGPGGAPVATTGQARGGVTVTGLAQGSTGGVTGPHFHVENAISEAEARAIFSQGTRSQLTTTDVPRMRDVHPVTGRRSMHYGYDLAGPANTPLNLSPGYTLQRFQNEGGAAGNAAYVLGPNKKIYRILHLANPPAGWTLPSSSIAQLDQAQSQARRPNVQQIDSAAVGSQALQISQQEAQVKKNILALQAQSNDLDAQAATEKLLAVARGAKELDQRRLELEIIKSKIEFMNSSLAAEKDGLNVLTTAGAEYSAAVRERSRANKEYLQQTAIEPELKAKVIAAMRQELAVMQQRYTLDREILILDQARAATDQALSTFKGIVEQNKQLDLEIEKRRLRNQLIIDGVNPAIAEGEARVLEIQNLLNRALSAQNELFNERVRLALDKYKIDTSLVDATFDLNEATIAGLIALEQDIDKQKKLKAELEEILKLRNQLRGVAESGAGQAISGTRESARKQAEPGQKIREYIAQATDELYDLEALAVRISQGIGDAIGNSLANGITGLIEGTTTAKEIFAGFLRDVGQILLKEGAKMIGTYIAIGIAKQFAGLFGGGSSGYSAAKDFQMPGSAFIPKGGFKFPGAANGAYFSNGMAAFANGGMFTNSVVSSPTLFKFADGGAMRMGLMGEAGPEAIMPLERGSDGRLGVRATGMQDAMQRYSTRSQQASEGNGGPGADGADGKDGNSVVDVRYNVERINNVDYVTADEFRAGMREAVAQGARQGERQTLRRLQQSSSARKRIGI